MRTANKLAVVTCGHTTLDVELVLSGHPDPSSVVRHLMPCVHEPGPDGKIAHPVYAYIIDHDRAQILVDTGMSDSFAKDWKNNFYRGAMSYDPGPDGLFTQQLAALGMKPGDFDEVIVTHLHTDHAGNVPLFADTKARIIVHEDELRGCISEKGGMLRDDLITLWGVTSPQGFTRKDFACLLPDRATTVFADQEIHRGVWTVSLPGHTWGTLGVAVNLPNDGWILLASDHIYLSASYGDPFYGNLLNQNPRQWAQSAIKVRRLVEKYSMRILPGHDNRIIVPDKEAETGYRLEDIAKAYD